MRRFPLLLMACTALLASCQSGVSQAPAQTSGGAPVTTPSAPTTTSMAAPVYELTLNPLDEAGDFSSIVALPSASPTCVGGGLSFTLTSSSSLVDSVGRTLHLRATYRVTNASSCTVTTPLYLPLVTAGSYATQDGTPFRSVTTRTGRVVSAAALSTERAQMVSGGVIRPDPTAPPLVASTGAGSPALPAGSLLQRAAPAGWQGQTLAPGDSDLVTFAAQVGLSGSDVSDDTPFRCTIVLEISAGQSAAEQPGTPGGEPQTQWAGQRAPILHA